MVFVLLAFFAFGTVTGAVVDDTVPQVHKVVDQAVHTGQ